MTQPLTPLPIYNLRTPPPFSLTIPPPPPNIFNSPPLSLYPSAEKEDPLRLSCYDHLASIYDLRAYKADFFGRMIRWVCDGGGGGGWVEEVGWLVGWLVEG